MNRSTFDTQLIGLCEYYGKDLSETLIEVYWNALKHVPDNVYVNAIAQVVLNSTFFPRLPEILKFIPKAEPLKIEEKAGLSWCSNTQALMNKYPCVRKENAA